MMPRGTELLIIFLVILLLFGATRLPQLGSSLGSAIKNFKRGFSGEEESHSDENVLSAEPYEGAVETVRAWSEQGHWIHVTSHRSGLARAATEEWLHNIGMPFNDLHCSYDKVTRCKELGVHVLVDDSPLNLQRAKAEGIVAATIVHPWNRELVEGGEAIGATDWEELRARLDPVLARMS